MNTNELKLQYEKVKLFYNSYFRIDLSLLANSLTYVTSLAIFPFLSLLLGISKGFGLDKILYEKLTKIITSDEKLLEYILGISNNLIETTKGEWLAGLGIVVLAWSVIAALMLLENSFNEIWHVKKPRSYKVRIMNYIALIFILPIFVILMLASSGLVFNIINKFAFEISILTFIFMKIFNLSVVIILFTFLFYIIPNTKVKIKNAFIGSLFTTTGLILLHIAYIYFQTMIIRYNTIYGSLAIVPIFLIWVRYVWLIILFGAQITYCAQNSVDVKIKIGEIPSGMKKDISLYIFYLIIKRFKDGGEAYTVSELFNKTKIKRYAIKDVLNELENMKFISEVHIQDSESKYQMNKDPDSISVKIFINKINDQNVENYQDVLDEMENDTRKEFEAVIKEIKCTNEKLINDINVD